MKANAPIGGAGLPVQPEANEADKHGRVSVVIIAGDDRIGRILSNAFCDDEITEISWPTSLWDREALQRLEGKADHSAVLVLAPGEASRSDRDKRLKAVEEAVRRWIGHGGTRLILVSSAAIYGPDHHSVGYVTEDTRKRPGLQNAVAEWWGDVEAIVRQLLHEAPREPALTVLRPVFLVGDGETGFMNRFLTSSRALPAAGFDPTLQFLHVSMLANAVRVTCEKELTGVYNLAPRDAVPLRATLRFLGIKPLRVFRSVQKPLRPRGLNKIDGIDAVDQLDYLCHPCTASGERFEREAEITFSSRESLMRLKRDRSGTAGSVSELPAGWDPFGLDEPFIRAAGKTGLRFFEKFYWRIEHRGLEHIPKEGKAIIVGPHRGFMPLDAVMLVHLITKYTGRVPRFLLHPTLVKFPVLARFMRRMGGVMACEKNAEWILNRGNVLGVYPEGIRGAFKMYRDAYRLGKFGRPNYIYWALKHNAPVVPFIVVGSAEIFPILGKIPWPWLKQYLEWPFIPITPTFPWLPWPLPTKWHVQFLPAIDPAGIVAEAARFGVDPPSLLGRRVREAIEAATAEMRARRRSIFWGRIWNEPDASSCAGASVRS